LVSEKALCQAVAGYWAGRLGLPHLAHEFPDEQVRHAPAVDLLARDNAGRAVLVLEHTLVESFPGQRAKQLAAIALFRPLEELLSGQLPAPGRYDLVVDPGKVLGLKHRITEIRSLVAEWTAVVAPPTHFASTVIPNTGLEITLYRWQGRQGRVRLVFENLADRDQQLTATLEKAFGDKCGKLESAKAQHGAEHSLLLLEIADAALGNLFDLDALVTNRVRAGTPALPNSIWLVDTTDDPASVLISREDNGEITDHEKRFLPFVLEWGQSSRESCP
jgi:hypothetical protein